MVVNTRGYANEVIVCVHLASNHHSNMFAHAAAVWKRTCDNVTVGNDSNIDTRDTANVHHDARCISTKVLSCYGCSPAGCGYAGSG